jgi:hypothetical protein
MRRDERRHFGNGLQLIPTLAQTVRTLATQGVRKPADVATALNASNKLTLAQERWTPRLAWLLLGFTFNPSPDGDEATQDEVSERKASDERKAAAASTMAAAATKRSQAPEIQSDKPKAGDTLNRVTVRSNPAVTPAEVAKPVSQDVLDAWLRRVTNKR